MIRPAKPNGQREVYVYDPATKAKRYVGQRRSLKEARLLEAEAKAARRPRNRADWSVDDFAAKFLADHHGPNTTRPGPATLRSNEHNLRAFRREYGVRKLASIDRDQAQTWARAHPGQAKTIAAMFAVAVDVEYLLVNPFARLGVGRGRGRSDIDPLTETEVERLAEIALKTLGPYGAEFWAFVLWQAWTGMRPGETCALLVSAVDFRAGTIRVERNARNDGSYGPVKGNVRRTIPLPDQAARAAQTLHRSKGNLFLSPTRLPLRPNSVRHYWAKVRAAFVAELPDSHWLRRRLMVNPNDQLVPYELRHFCGSMLADRGLSAQDIAHYLGNSARVCEQTYIHAHEDRIHGRIRAALAQTTEPAVTVRAETRETAA